MIDANDSDKRAAETGAGDCQVDYGPLTDDGGYQQEMPDTVNDQYSVTADSRCPADSYITVRTGDRNDNDSCSKPRHPFPNVLQSNGRVGGEGCQQNSWLTVSGSIGKRGRGVYLMRGT